MAQKLSQLLPEAKEVVPQVALSLWERVGMRALSGRDKLI
jgi:hypothetical protein